MRKSLIVLSLIASFLLLTGCYNKCGTCGEAPCMKDGVAK